MNYARLENILYHMIVGIDRGFAFRYSFFACSGKNIKDLRKRILMMSLSNKWKTGHAPVSQAE